MTEQRIPLAPLPPHPEIRDFGEGLEPGVRRTILDAGTGIGRNAHYLAELGHAVVALDTDIAQLRAIQDERQLDIASLTNLHLVTGDVRRLPFGPVFNVAFITN